MPKHEEEASPKKRKKGVGFVGIIRIVISMIMVSIFMFGIYKAYVNFSGVDPLKVKPSSAINHFFKSERVYDVINAVLTFDPKKNSLALRNLSTQPDSKVEPKDIPSQPKELAYKFAVVTDSHNDNLMLAKALALSEKAGAEFIIGLGDYSDVGTVQELVEAKKIFDSQQLSLYSTIGDHDLWDSRNKNLDPTQNFRDVFGLPYQSFHYKGARMILVYNSDNYLGIDGVQMKWITEQLERATEEKDKLIFVFTSSPLYHPSSDHVMGKTNEKVKRQAQELIDLFFRYKVSEIISGDVHFYSDYVEPKTNLNMTVSGAVTSVRNLQAPRFLLIDVFVDGSYNIQDTEIK